MTATFESNLVETLLKQGLLDGKELELARHYQSRMALKGRNLPITQTLVDLGLVDRNLIHQMMIEESFLVDATAKDHQAQIEELIHAKTEPLQRQYDDLQSAMEITGQVISSPTLYELYQQICSQVIKHYGYQLVGFFKPNNEDQSLILSQFSLAPGIDGLDRATMTSSNNNSGVTSAFQNRRFIIVSHDLSPDGSKPEYLLPETLTEINIPVIANEEILAIFHVQSSNKDAFDTGVVNLLQTIIASIAPVVQYHHSIDSTKEILGTLSTLYQASQVFSQARISEDVYRQVLKYLKPLPYKSIILAVNNDHWHPIASDDNLSWHDRLIHALDTNKITSDEIENGLIFQEYLLFTKDSKPSGVSETLYSTIGEIGVSVLAILPMLTNHQLVSLIFLYSESACSIDESTLQFLTSLVDLASTSLQRVKYLEAMERRFARLEVLDSISRSITFETDIHTLYRVIHEQITRVMGDIDIIIATYDPDTNSIEIPYAVEENKILSIAPFDLGDGLTSILIKSRKPLLLVDEVEKKAVELGAKVIGAPAKSWLGVPLLLGGEPIGAIIVQDLEKEHRFDDEDQHLLSTLSSQLAVSIRNARLIYEASSKSDLENAAVEITNRLWAVTDVETIMQTALEQLGTKLHASKGIIQLELNNRELLNSSTERALS